MRGVVAVVRYGSPSRNLDMKSKKVEFTPPDEVKDQIGDIPAGTRLELMTRYAVKDNGRWCITSIEGVPMPGYDAEGNPTDKEEHMEGGDFAKKYQEHMAEGGGY